MYVIPGLRHNKFVYVAIPSKREMYERMRSHLSAPKFSESTDGDPFTDPVNVYDGMNKVERNDTARYLANQAAAKEADSI